MLRDIIIGQYYPEKSIIHGLDPRVKLFGTMIFIISLFVNESIWGYVLATVFVTAVIKMSKVPFKYIIKGLKGILFLLLFSVIFTVFFTDGEVLVKIGFIKITDNGLIRGAKVIVRLIYLIIGSSVMTLTTTPTDIADGLEKSFRPLTCLKVPVHDIAMMMSIAFRFIPILTEETDKIIKAQMARGADFETGGLIKKAKAMIPLIVPLVVSSVKRALDLATAMEARCYQGGDGRTKMKPLKYKKGDYAAYLVFALYMGIMIGMRVLL
ncbi:MAG: energy-coupling factor transporter transmembrane component T family protein [Lachnospiraceae bacterium]